jgi:methylenetetrahydrofolate dehydrogenase (NADP+)/methenyltetrahydrofolate cyclohydrolase
MAAEIIDGKAVAQRVRDEVARDVAQLDRAPGLATLLVGDDPASAIYVANKRKQCEAAGLRDLHQHVAGDVSQDELAAIIEALNADPDVTGILLQLPVPGHVDSDAMIELIHPDKDVDGLTTTNAGRLVQNRPGLVSCTPLGVMELLEHESVDLRGAEAVILGRSQLVGRPLASLLLARDATVTMCHSRTRNLAEVCSRADVLVAAVGQPKLVTSEMVREGAVVIDVGINRTDDGLVGDVDFDAVARKAAAITPVPGGVGPMTIAMLLVNTVKAARMQRGLLV